MHLGIYLLLLFWVGYTKRLGAIQVNKSNSYKRKIKNYFCIFNFEEYFKLTIYVARRESIKKNNKLSKVDWDITMINSKIVYLQKNEFWKKINPLIIFYFQINKFKNLKNLLNKNFSIINQSQKMNLQ